MKVCFLSWHFASPRVFLESLLKMTPSCSGKWKDMEAVLNPFDADFCIVMDGYNAPFPEERAIYIGEHPNVENHSPAFRKWENKTALLRLHLDAFVNPGEWWIKHDYDYLSALELSPKEKQLCCIATYQTHNTMYNQRVNFLQALCKTNTPIDIYGRPEERYKADALLVPYYRGSLGFNKPNGLLAEHLVGKEVVGDYKYSLELDVGPTKNYFSERFYDALLLWTKPIYFGSNNIHEFIPREAFNYVNIYDLSQVSEVHRMVTEEINYKAIAEARDLLLNKYQLWPYIYNTINGL
jgi:hypothetical protein